MAFGQFLARGLNDSRRGRLKEKEKNGVPKGFHDDSMDFNFMSGHSSDDTFDSLCLVKRRSKTAANHQARIPKMFLQIGEPVSPWSTRLPLKMNCRCGVQSA